MILVPRPYQIRAVDSVYRFFQEHPFEGNPLVVMPTGTGKAVVIAMLAESILRQWYTQRILVLTHVKELVGQNHEKMTTYWPAAPAGINSAGLNRRDWVHPILFAGIGSVAKYPQKLGHIDLIFIDECDLVSPDNQTQYMKLFAALMKVNPRLRIIGFTATDWRQGTGKLTNPGGIFTHEAINLTTLEEFNKFFDEGYLKKLIPKRTNLQLDVTGVHKIGGELNQGELQIAVDKDEITWQALQETMSLASDRKHWLIFASGIQHGNNIQKMLDYLGISNVVIHSEMGTTERDEGVSGFKTGKYKAAINYGVLTTGFDFPEIDLIVVLRPTMSSRLWVQMLGRGTRPVYAPGFDLSTNHGRLEAIAASDYPDCLVLDFAKNAESLGPINDPVIPEPRGKGPPGEAPIKICQVCNTYNHSRATHCICCNAEFQFFVKLKAQAGTSELISPGKDLIVPEIKQFTVSHVTYHRHEKIGKPPSMRVNYFCGLGSFDEYVCPEHEGFAQRKARQWWKERTDSPFPADVHSALRMVRELKVPSHINVQVNIKPTQITGYLFDGKAIA